MSCRRLQGSAVLQGLMQINVKAVHYVQEIVRMVQFQAKLKEPHVIDQSKCLKCGACMEKCLLWRNLQRVMEEQTMENITIKINGVEVSAPAGSTILEAARLAHIDIPTLCYLKEINEIGACRMCIVEVKGARSLVASCVYPINPGMEVWTNTPKVIESRKKTLELLLSNHKKECLSCVRSGNCELQQLCKELGVEDENYYSGECDTGDDDITAAHMDRVNSKVSFAVVQC